MNDNLAHRERVSPRRHATALDKAPESMKITADHRSTAPRDTKRTRLLRVVAAGAVVLVPLLGAGACVTTGTQVVSGTILLDVVDHENVGQNEGTSATQQFWVNPQRDSTISLPSIGRCAGEEVRVEVDLRVNVDAAGTAEIAGSARLYEGTDCGATAVDAGVAIKTIPVAPGRTAIAPFELRDSSVPDFAVVTILVANFTGDEASSPRRAVSSGSLHIVDHENVGDNEGLDVPIESDSVAPSGPGLTAPLSVAISRADCAGDEVRVHTLVKVAAEHDGTVVGAGLLRLYEGDDCGASALDGYAPIELRVAPGATVTAHIRVDHAAVSREADHADLVLSLTNRAT